MKKKSLKTLMISSKMISNLSSQSIIGGGYTQSSGCSYDRSCDPSTDVGGGASCRCQ